MNKKKHNWLLDSVLVFNSELYKNVEVSQFAFYGAGTHEKWKTLIIESFAVWVLTQQGLGIGEGIQLTAKMKSSGLGGPEMVKTE